MSLLSSNMATATSATAAATTATPTPPTSLAVGPTRTSDCRKFSPNIFNKSKCSHCFRQREEHSAAALECNRASRKISKCGYLFVAPDWDFSNPLYRTKRWQRRWFVLYDDGELTYSVDEHPETVPQACIDMTKVLEVATAESITGHSHSIAITAPDRVTFVKGTCPEESKWWFNILAAFPKAKGRHKRNATFPGAQATNTLQSPSNAETVASLATNARGRHNSYHKDILTSTQSSSGVLVTSNISNTNGDEKKLPLPSSATSKIETCGSNNGNSNLWSSHNDVVTTLTTTTASTKKKGTMRVSSKISNNTTSVIKDNHHNLTNVEMASVEDDGAEDDDDDEDDGVETGDEEDDDDDDDEDDEDDEREEKEDSPDYTGREINSKKKSTSSSVNDENNRNAVNEIKTRVSPPCLLIDDIRRDEKTIKDLTNTITNLSQQKNRWTSAAVSNVFNTHMHQNNNNNNNIKCQEDDKKSRDETDFYRPSSMVAKATTNSSNESQTHLRPTSLPLAANSTPAIVSAIVKKIPPVLATTTPSTSATYAKSSQRLYAQQQQQNLPSRKQQQKQALERGDPDGGCNLDDFSSNYLSKTVELRVSVTSTHPSVVGSSAITTNTSTSASPALSESLNAKKGWLMKQDNRTGDWTKHWFTLSGAALFFYRDPVSEERGVLDGVLDVNSLTNIAEVNANRSYAFQLMSWDKRRLVLASLSPNSRNSWIAILRNAAGLPNSSTTATTTTTLSATTPQSVSATNQSNQSTTCGIKHSPSTAAATAASENNKSIPTTTELIIKDNTSDDMKSEIEKDFIKAQRIMQNFTEPNNNSSSIKSSCLTSNNNNGKTKNSSNETSPQVIITNVSGSGSLAKNSSLVISPQTSMALKTAYHFSSDEEYRTASEGGRRDSIGDWGSPLSPSPPTTLNLMRTKDRMRARTITPCPRMHKRSRSSPPSSRRSTVESVGSDELPAIHTVHEEANFHVELQFRLSTVEKERDLLKDEAKEREARMSELLSTLERTEQELNNRIQEMEEVRDSLTTQLEDAKRNASEIITRLTDELEEGQRKIKDLEERLALGIDENESLYKRLREMESCSPGNFLSLQRSKMKRLDSLSDLTHINDIDPFCIERDSLAEEYNELKGRFEKAVNEIRAMKRELKESQNQYDSLEISYASLKQDLERKEIEDQSQLQMMADRIHDLTLKYTSSERQVRILKQKLAKSERRRSLSLKGKEQLNVSKELEIKLLDLESKLDELEKSHRLDVGQNVEGGNQPPTSRTASKRSSRRKSLESNASDSLQFLVRVTDLEKRFEGVNSSRSSSCTPTPSSSTPTLECPSQSPPASNLRLSEHLVERLRCLENVLVSSKDRLEQSLSQLQNLRSSRTRRSVSPITDRKDSYRFVERCLNDVVKLMRESTETCVLQSSHPDTNQSAMFLLSDSSPVKKALTQLESQLRSKLAELLKQRRMLRECNEMTRRKDLELLAERIAFESVCFGKLKESVERAENPELFMERQVKAEVAETSHLMSMLKAKIQGKCSVNTTSSLDILAGVLARRLLLSTYQKGGHGGPVQQFDSKMTMEPVDQNLLDDLLRQQNEINAMSKRYKNNAMENLADSLAAETLSYISTNDLVQNAVQEAWRQAQETVNAEIVQSEIAHIMMRNAERLESSVVPSFGFTLTSEERLSFEKFADAVHDMLRLEMEAAVTQLTQCFEESMRQMKRGHWRTHLQQERKASEGRQLLSDFADIVAHKALVDARIGVLRGEYGCQTSNSKHDEEHEVQKLGITALQKYENLFEELSSDLQITNPDDILLEADFEFMYKQHAVDFLSDRQVLCEISTFLSQLEDSLIALQCEATSSSNEHLPRTEISIESLQDVCHKCCDLRKRADQLLQEVHRKLNDSCQHCLQVREKLHSMQEQHESEILRLKQSQAKDLKALMQQVEHQRTALRYLEAEKNAINQDLNKSEELAEEREKELQSLTQRLHAKAEALQATQEEQHKLLKRLEAEDEKVRSYQEESDALTMKCARQDDEYVILLQERDCLHAELSKERDRSRRFEQRLELLEMEHSKQLECLQEAYGTQMMAHCSDLVSEGDDEESFRRRYQAEIVQLRTLCEKGLTAMESSHRRTINDLEEKHKQEIERLLIEKETALAEETQATLAALDAMRKAHQSEVQREVARFKQEFLKQFQQKGERSLGSSKAKEEELEELRQDILSFSEKYSTKCVENAALEEKLRVSNQKLRHLQQMQQLELRNKQFRAHLSSDDPSKDVQYLHGLNTTKDGDDNCAGAMCQEDSEHVHATRRRYSNQHNNDQAGEGDKKMSWEHHQQTEPEHATTLKEKLVKVSCLQQQQQQQEWQKEQKANIKKITTEISHQPSATPPLLQTQLTPAVVTTKQQQRPLQLQSIIIIASEAATSSKSSSLPVHQLNNNADNDSSSTDHGNDNFVVGAAAAVTCNSNTPSSTFDTTSITDTTISKDATSTTTTTTTTKSSSTTTATMTSIVISDTFSDRLDFVVNSTNGNPDQEHHTQHHHHHHHHNSKKVYSNLPGIIVCEFDTVDDKAPIPHGPAQDNADPHHPPASIVPAGDDDDDDDDDKATVISLSDRRNSRIGGGGAAAGASASGGGKFYGDDADDNLDNCRYSYQPCYKQTNLFNYQNRMLSFEGLITKKTKYDKTRKSLDVEIKSNNNTKIISQQQQQQQQHQKPKIFPIPHSTLASKSFSSSSSTTITTSAAIAPIMSTTTLTPPSKNEQQQQQQQQIYKSTKLFQINDNFKILQDMPTIIPITTTSHLMQSEEQQQQLMLQKANKPEEEEEEEEILKAAREKKSVLNPVDLPKNLSAFNAVNFNFSHLPNMDCKRNNNIPNNTTTTITTTKTATATAVSYNINNNCKIKSLIKYTTTTPLIRSKTTTPSLATTTTPTTPTTTLINNYLHLKVAEKSAINLNSFTDIIEKTTATTTINLNKTAGADDDEKLTAAAKQQQQRCKPSLLLTSNAKVVNDKSQIIQKTPGTQVAKTNVTKQQHQQRQQHLNLNQQYQGQHQQQQQHQQQHYNQQYQQSQYNQEQQFNTLPHETDAITMKTKRSRISSSSPPPLDGRDVEIAINTSTSISNIINTTTNTQTTANTLSTIHSLRQNSPPAIRGNIAKSSSQNSSQYKRFELEI